MLPGDTQAARATAALARAFGPGFALPMRIVVDGRGRTVRGDPAVAALAARVAADPETARVDPLVAYSRDGTVALLTVYARHGDDSDEAQALVGRIATRDAPAAAALRGDAISVGGSASQNRDFRRTVEHNLPLVIGVVMLLTFLVLVVLFRSLLLPLKAVVMTLLSAVAAYGVLVMVFQWGWGDSLLGFESRGHVTSWVPPFLFSILFGLSMDYEVFMLSRIREARARGLSDRAAVAEGLARSGRIITAAAAIMIVVFLSFLTNRLIPIKESALGLAVAVFLDATVVRIVLVPAFMRLAGRWNWWLPAPLERALPRGPARDHGIREPGLGCVRGDDIDPTGPGHPGQAPRRGLPRDRPPGLRGRDGRLDRRAGRRVQGRLLRPLPQQGRGVRGRRARAVRGPPRAAARGRARRSSSRGGRRWPPASPSASPTPWRTRTGPSSSSSTPASPSATPARPPSTRAEYAAWADLIADLLDRSRELGLLDFEGEARAVARVLMAVVDGFSIQAIIDPESVRQEEVAPMVAHLFSRALGG